MHRYESFGGLSEDVLDEDLDTTYLPPSPSPGQRIRPRAAMDGEDYMDLTLDDNEATSDSEATSETSVYASLDDDHSEEETSDAVFEEAEEQAEAEAEAEAENLHAHRRRVHFSSSASPPPTHSQPAAAAPAARAPPSSPPMLPPPRPPTQPIHITLSRLPVLTAGQPPLHIRINTIRRRLPSSQPSPATILAARRVADTALATTRQRLVAIFASFGMRDRDEMVDWKAIDNALVTNDDHDDINDDDDDDNGAPPLIDPATQREVEGWLARTMGWYTGRGVTEVYPEEYYDDDDGEAAAAAGGRPQRQRQGRRNCMIKGSCEMRAVFASEMQMQAVIRAIEVAGAMGDGVRSMATVLRFWNEEWRAENPDLAIEGDDLGVGDVLRLRAIRPLDKEWEE